MKKAGGRGTPPAARAFLPVSFLDIRTLLPYLVPVKSKQFIQRLRAAGAQVVKPESGGSHYMAYLNGRKAPVMHHSADLSNDYCKRVCKQLGLEPKEVL